MPRKKPSPIPSTATKAQAPFPIQRQKTGGPVSNLRQQADNRWQRTKRYAWDGR